MARRKFAMETCDKYGALGRTLLLLGDWVLLSGVASALRIVDDLLAEVKPLFGAICAAVDVIVTATEKITMAQEKLGLLKKTGSTVDEVFTEATKEVEADAHAEAPAKPFVQFKEKATEEVKKAWEAFKAKRAEGKGEGEAAVAAAEEAEVCHANTFDHAACQTLLPIGTACSPSKPTARAVALYIVMPWRAAAQEEAAEGIKKMIPNTERAMGKVVGCVTIPLALIGWIVAISSPGMEGALFIASATAFA